MSKESQNYINLNWDNNRKDLFNTFQNMFEQNEITDVTIYCKDYKIQAHKLILCAASPYLRKILNDMSNYQHPVLILNDFDYTMLLKILKFIYIGEICIESTGLEMLLKCAQSLQIVNLVDIITNYLNGDRNTTTQTEQNDNNRNSRTPEEGSLRQELQPEDVVVKTEFDNVTGYSSQSDESNNTNNELTTILPVNCKIEDDMVIEETMITQTAEASSYPDIKQRINRFPEDRLRCNVCGKVFVHPYSLHHHRAVHAGGTQCSICNVVLSRKYNLKMHMKARHGQ